jgi:NitT/TauT family transport system substrate-binding protein
MTVPLLAVVALAGCSSSSPDSTSNSNAPVKAVNLKVGFDNALAYTNNMPVLIAEQEGFFKKQHITVTNVDFSGGSDTTRALVAGSIDVQAGVGFDAVAGNANNLNVKIFYSIAQKTDFALYGSTAAGVAKPSDFKGKSLAVSSFGSWSDFLARSTPKAAGLSADDIKVEAIGTNAALFGAIQTGATGGTWNPASLASVIKGSTIIGTTTSLKIPTQYSSLIATGDWLQKNPAVAKRFSTAISKAIAWHQDSANKAAAVAIAVKTMKLPQAAAEAGYEGASKIFTDDGKVSVPGLKAMAAAVPTLKLGPSAPDTNDMYTNKFLPAK